MASPLTLSASVSAKAPPVKTLSSSDPVPGSGILGCCLAARGVVVVTAATPGFERGGAKATAVVNKRERVVIRIMVKTE